MRALSLAPAEHTKPSPRFSRTLSSGLTTAPTRGESAAAASTHLVFELHIKIWPRRYARLPAI
jgi:hypothetical protein